MSDTRAKIIATIYDVVKPERPDLSDHSQALLDGALDSLDFASVLMALEDEFDFQISDSDSEKLGSIDNIVAFIDGRKKG